MQLKGARIAAYARYSSDRQSESSVEDQLRRLHAFAAARGRTIDPKLIFTDHAISGASTARPAFESLMALVKARAIDVLLVEDTSRLSRDNADALNLYKTFTFYGVQLVAISDGIDSSSKGAKLAYSVKALMSDLYLEDLRDKTLRGMEGRAHTGLSTGGLPFGYRSVPMPGHDPRTPAGFRVEIVEDAAKVVRRIFKDWINGGSFNSIAKALNEEGIASPRDKTMHKRKSGWAGSSIRAMLLNEKYAGVWTFNERRWIKVPGTNKRVPQWKDPSEVIRYERPHLAIVDEETWQRAKTRLEMVRALYKSAPDGKRNAKPLNGTKGAHPFSSILHCECGAPMTIMGGFGTTRYYGCVDAKRGRCPNRTSVKESTLKACYLGELKKKLATRAGAAHARALVEKTLEDAARERDSELTERRTRLARLEAQLARSVEAIADGRYSKTVMDSIHEIEAKAVAEREAIAKLGDLATERLRLADPEEIMAKVFQIEEMVGIDPAAAREALRRLHKDGRITVKLGSDGVWTAQSDVLPAVLVLEAQKVPGVSPRDLYANVVAGAGFEPTTFGL
jgi:site-specific DNA recombinase